MHNALSKHIQQIKSSYESSTPQLNRFIVRRFASPTLNFTEFFFAYEFHWRTDCACMEACHIHWRPTDITVIIHLPGGGVGQQHELYRGPMTVSSCLTQEFCGFTSALSTFKLFLKVYFLYFSNVGLVEEEAGCFSDVAISTDIRVEATFNFRKLEVSSDFCILTTCITGLHANNVHSGKRHCDRITAYKFFCWRS